MEDEWNKAHEPSSSSGSLTIQVVPVDLSNLSSLEDTFAPIFSKIEQNIQQYQQAMFVHNAGSLGALTFTHEWTSLDELRRVNDFNITSTMWLTKQFLALFGAPRTDESTEALETPKYIGPDHSSLKTSQSNTGVTSKSSHLIVNISSLCGKGMA